MKNFFGVDAKTYVQECEKFEIRSADPVCVNKLAEFKDSLRAVERKIFPPVLLATLCVLMLGIFAMLVFVEVFVDGENLSLTELYAKAPWAIYCFVILAVCFFALIIYALIRQKIMKTNGGYNSYLEEGKKLLDKCYESMSVPSTASAIDVFTRTYKQKNGLYKPSALSSYVASEVKVFSENGNLCFADELGVYAVPLKSLRNIDRIEKRITFGNWNKDQPYNKGMYKQFKIRKNGKSSDLSVKPYYSAKITVDYEDYEILIPCYDIELFLKNVNTGISA